MAKKAKRGNVTLHVVNPEGNYEEKLFDVTYRSYAEALKHAFINITVLTQSESDKCIAHDAVYWNNPDTAIFDLRNVWGAVTHRMHVTTIA